jgi:4-amino-4-deoxy-L-arabinose transferase-like glycosyltransferase
MLPWTVVGIAAYRDSRAAIAEGDWKERPGVYFGCWIVFMLLFFTFSQSKLPGYLLPALPPLILILADSAARMIRERDTLARWVCALIGASWLLMVLIGIAMLDRLPITSGLADPTLWRWWMVAGAVGGILIAALGWGRRIAGALLLNAILFTGVLEAANWTLVPIVDSSFSARPTAQVALARGLPSHLIYIYEVPVDWQFGLEYYLRRTLPDFPIDPDAARSIIETNPTYVFTNQRGCAELAAQDFVCEPIEQLAPPAWLVRVRLKSPATP